MIELINSVAQTVPVGGAVAFDTQVQKGGCCERHREGSSQITLTKPGRYLITFSGNLSVPTGGAVGEVSVSIAQEGENINGTVMRITPAAVNEYFNVSSQTYVVVCGTCCETVSVRNAGAAPVQVENPNLTAVRVNG